ncbi:hypothetical protein SAY86_031591 [Trapa natans]|uniref:Uncharacterized protein n=1 Tax=Trapa natans TaxID=22666 RepID=A0AAN7R9V1_TRANT|nr:hypothetical protein SAY86_031591 [Trapa natans]
MAMESVNLVRSPPLVAPSSSHCPSRCCPSGIQIAIIPRSSLSLALSGCSRGCFTQGCGDRRLRWGSHIARMAPEEEKMTRRSPLDFPIEWERPKPGRRPDIFPQFSPMKTPLPPPLPADPPEEDEEEEEKKEEEEEDPEKEADPENPEKQ